MKELLQKVAYLQGLADGLELEDSKEGRLIKEILTVLEVMSDCIGAIDDQVEDMEDYLESIDSDLADVEDEVFDIDDEDEDDDMVDVECPNCHEQVCFDSSILYDDDLIEVTCPNCGAVVFVNDEEDEEEEDEEEEE